MTDLLSKIWDDINEYIWLCEKYNEPVVYKVNMYGDKKPDIYGKHHNELLDRETRTLTGKEH